MIRVNDRKKFKKELCTFFSYIIIIISKEYLRTVRIDKLEDIKKSRKIRTKKDI